MPRKSDSQETREYVSRDPHTVALVRQEPDALKRLEKWLSNPRLTRALRWAYYSRQSRWFQVALESGSISYAANGETLSAAIHAALDQAEAKR